MPILFWRARDQPYGVFSNFSWHPIEIDGKRWPSSEHYYQASKFFPTDPAYAESIRLTKRAGDAASMGRDTSRPLRKDWEEIKEQEMMRALRAKFTSYPELKTLLLSTGDERIVEDSPKDPYWGVGPKGTGQNRLGELLMQLRGKLREELSHGFN